MSPVRWTLTALGALALTGCDDTIWNNGGGGDAGNFTGGCAVFASECTACHSGGQEPDLRPDNLPNLVGVASAEYPDKTYIVAGDPEGSFVYQKITGTHDAGGDMPPTGALDQAAIDAVAQYITDGALVCEGDLPIATLEPGAPIEVGAMPEGFGTAVPSWAETEVCYTEQWWQHSGDEEEGVWMHPGQACIDCHKKSGEEDAPTYSFAGTIMGGVDDETDCRGIPGVTVELLNIDDEVFITKKTNAAGNFFVKPSEAPFQEFRVRLTYDGRNREMLNHTDLSGDCNGCHTPVGEEGAPGRIVAP